MNGHRKYTATWKVTRTHYDMSLMQLCYFAALCESIRLVDEIARERGVPPPELDYNALRDYTLSKGVQIYKLQEGI